MARFQTKPDHAGRVEALSFSSCLARERLKKKAALRHARGIRFWGMACGLALALAACTPSKLAYPRLKSALVDAGLSEANSACMADRMTDKLTLGQLRKLEALKSEKRSMADYVAAVRRLSDAELISATVGSAALCTTGLAR